MEVNGVTNTLSTLNLTPDYEETVTKYMAQFGILNATRFSSRYLPANSYKSPALTPLDLAMGGDPKALLKEAARYAELHRSLFGTYEGEMMPRPTPEVMAQLQGTYLEFMQRNGFKEILQRIDLSQRTTGYK